MSISLKGHSETMRFWLKPIMVMITCLCLAIDVLAESATNETAEKLIACLSHPSEKMRIDAADSLGRMGDRLTRPQLSEIVKLMRSGNAEWSKLLYREGQCLHYEKVSVKYYAALALTNIVSPLIDEGTISEARSIVRQGKVRYKVTDLGYI
jgi:hypothetical protein